MEAIKTTPNLEFDVIYADGTRKRVKEGVLYEVADDTITFHNGTDRLSVLFASVDAALRVVDLLGVIPLLRSYLLDDLVSVPARKLFGLASPEKQAIFRLGQKDMQAAVADMLLAMADGAQGVICSTLIDAAERVRKMEAESHDEG